ncbi:type IV pilus assembly protein PilN [Acinetobacter calcoaceticus]|uniref:Type IV pilus assembly protein PilN n=1 Tax=Acinetobacter calcoaceticus TaxID=471 RepID=A0A4R1Y246_ACICA|nr:type IV pilus assembly protein PilN [Acinetobacter calcoaceticus]
MSKINLLPWRDELRELKKQRFIAISILSAVCGLFSVMLAWSYFAYKFEDQNEANQLIVSSNQSLDQQLKKIQGLKEQRNAIIEHMRLIQGLQSQRPTTVRIIDELVRVIPAGMYLTKISRVDGRFSIEGRAENPNTVAELMRRLEASPWFRNAFMSRFLAVEEKTMPATGSVVPRVEAKYGSFTVTADVGEIANPQVSSSPSAVMEEAK